MSFLLRTAIRHGNRVRSEMLPLRLPVSLGG